MFPEGMTQEEFVRRQEITLIGMALPGWLTRGEGSVAGKLAASLYEAQEKFEDAIFEIYHARDYDARG